MKLEDVNSIDDVERYLEGCLNDFDAGLSDKTETMNYMGDLILKVYKMALKTVPKADKLNLMMLLQYLNDEDELRSDRTYEQIIDGFNKKDL